MCFDDWNQLQISALKIGTYCCVTFGLMLRCLSGSAESLNSMTFAHSATKVEMEFTMDQAFVDLDVWKIKWM